MHELNEDANAAEDCNRAGANRNAVAVRRAANVARDRATVGTFMSILRGGDLIAIFDLRDNAKTCTLD